MYSRLRTFAATLAALALALATTSTTSVPPASALAKIKCKQTTGTAAIDPIVHHNQRHASVHVHQFFGNNSWLDKGNAANYKDLVGKSTNCENAADTAGYWMPRLTTLSGRPVQVQAFTAYYRPFTGIGGPEFGLGQVMPADTRLVGSRYRLGLRRALQHRPASQNPLVRGAVRRAWSHPDRARDVPQLLGWEAARPCRVRCR
ncbi:MAG: DUF1996 domain-containing protein [Nocardioidaceae bacterium]